jgi:hypothetical protein
MATIDLRRKKDDSIAYRVRLRKKGQKMFSITLSNIVDAQRFVENYEADFMKGRRLKLHKSWEVMVDDESD